MDSRQIDSLQFESALKKENFRIKKFGAVNLSRMNEPFEYTARVRNVPVKTFIVGPANRDFTPFYRISSFLRHALLTAEDGAFFFHRGFNEEAFRKSIVQNIQEERFARGGSTISMQLVKNVFLSPQKTVSRKLEEALIVWLIENNQLTSKERMYEVYLNIIEWGPGIFGIKEASRFYFDKRPFQLTLAESIFLTSIVPRPRYFQWNFDEEGKLREFLHPYYKQISAILLRKGLITEYDANKLKPEIVLRGPAKEYLRGMMERKKIK